MESKWSDHNLASWRKKKKHVQSSYKWIDNTAFTLYYSIINYVCFMMGIKFELKLYEYFGCVLNDFLGTN